MASCSSAAGKLWIFQHHWEPWHGVHSMQMEQGFPISTPCPQRHLCGEQCRLIALLIPGRRRGNFVLPHCPKPKQGLSDTHTSILWAVVMEAVPNMMLCVQGWVGGILSQTLGETAVTRMHDNQQELCKEHLYLALAQTPLGFPIPLHLSPIPAPCCWVFLSTCTARLFLPFFPANSPSPPSFKLFLFFPKSILRSVSSSLTSLCHPLASWSAAAFPQFFLSSHHLHPLQGSLALWHC